VADSERLVIDHVGHHGDGVAIAGGGNIYVPYTLGGETIEAAAVPGHHPDRRRLLKVEAASVERIAPFCPHFGVCGGCAIQHWDAAPYRAWKRELVVTVLAQAGIDCDVAPLVDAHGAGRRRITLHGRMGTHDVLKVGYAAAGSHDIIPIDRCPILDPGLNGAIEAAWAIAEPLISIGKPLDIQITATKSGLDVDVRGSGPLSTALITSLSRIAEQHRLARLTRHGELVLMRTPPVISIGAAQVALPPGSFLQATVAGEETLAALVSEHCKRGKSIADLFCGVGPFALRLAAKSRVTAFDSDAGSVTARPVSPPADAAGIARLRYGGVRPAATGRAGASDAACGQQNSDGGRGIVQRRDVCAGREDFDRPRLQDRRRDASRPVPPHAACGIGGAVQAVSALSSPSPGGGGSTLMQ